MDPDQALKEIINHWYNDENDAFENKCEGLKDWIKMKGHMPELDRHTVWTLITIMRHQSILLMRYRDEQHRI